MQGVFQHLDRAVRADAQLLVNLGLIHRRHDPDAAARGLALIGGAIDDPDW